MLASLSIARLFCGAGGLLALVGLILWWRLPIHLAMPPFFFTPILAGGYGLWCWKRSGKRDEAGE